MNTYSILFSKDILTLIIDLQKVNIQGPFGSATRDIFEVEHAVLIAAGIGVTPFAAILQSIMYRYIASKKTCPKCRYDWYEQIPDHVMKLKRVVTHDGVKFILDIY